MKEIKFLQTGDIHLETAFTGQNFSLEMARRRRNEIKEVFSRIIKIAEESKVDLILITGDLFEHKFVTKSVIRFMQRKLLRIPHIKVFITPGDSDPALADSYYRTFCWPKNVHIFLEDHWKYVDLPHLNLRVYGFGWNQWEIKKPLLRELKIESGNCLNLVMLHGDTFGRLGESNSLPISESDLRECKADYVALGHIHQNHRVPSKGKIIANYAGSPEPLGFGEPGEHGVLMGVLSKKGVNLKFLSTAKRTYFENKFRITSEMSIKDICNGIRDSAKKEDRMHHLYRLKLTGEKDEAVNLSNEVFQELLKDDYFYLEVKDYTNPDYDLEAVIRENLHTAPGIFTLKMKEEIDREKGREREVINKALYYGLDTLLGKKVSLR
ncbi:metallophosphoesterase family protein [Candidatus Contubernalis alkaliaceticus]|uniref:metallophosphoesterase family protein n=1 Tax=Candidatus Contubernalis alkaliaceticus TaxID=338645 RepID=UPI001F4C4D7B|nr:DNA repair exonuclease [Candidatus Contubernalis alkalaceticus]UNC92389.1 DNA repair exonuclease [Candidatus Contubernalis alkalaceticus]